MESCESRWPAKESSIPAGFADDIIGSFIPNGSPAGRVTEGAEILKDNQ